MLTSCVFDSISTIRRLLGNHVLFDRPFEHTPGAVAYIAAVPGGRFGVQSLDQGHISRGIEDGESAGVTIQVRYF